MLKNLFMFTTNINWKIYLPLFAICVAASFVGGWLAYILFVISHDSATFITAFANLIVAVATIFLVFITNRVVSATKDTIHGQILLQLSRDYASDDMLTAIKHLRNLQKCQGENFIDNFIAERNKNLDWEYDRYRRRVSHHFFQIYLLWESHVINHNFIETLIKQGKIDFFLEVIKPLDLAIAEKLEKDNLDETKVEFLKKDVSIF